MMWWRHAYSFTVQESLQDLLNIPCVYKASVARLLMEGDDGAELIIGLWNTEASARWHHHERRSCRVWQLHLVQDGVTKPSWKQIHELIYSLDKWLVLTSSKIVGMEMICYISIYTDTFEVIIPENMWDWLYCSNSSTSFTKSKWNRLNTVTLIWTKITKLSKWHFSVIVMFPRLNIFLIISLVYTMYIILNHLYCLTVWCCYSSWWLCYAKCVIMIQSILTNQINLTVF